MRHYLNHLLAPCLQQHAEALLEWNNSGGANSGVPPPHPFDPDVFLQGNLKRVFKAGRFDVLEVGGYSFPP